MYGLCNGYSGKWLHNDLSWKIPNRMDDANIWMVDSS
jgi:hypothetical protein